MSQQKRVRVRLAPSPTGDPHVGTAYVTLFNYVFAKKFGGDLILRIEDTDQARTRASSEAQIFTSLKWLGLHWDEGPDCGGAYGPYRQSERLGFYTEYAAKLLATGHAYQCFCTSERLEALRQQQRQAGERTGYDGHCRELSPEQVLALKAQGAKPVVRLKIPREGTTSFTDALRGSISIQNSQLDDQVLMKSDGFPTYHFANVVDDHLMEISHVIRAEEWISSTPKHVLLYEAFGWEAPVFAHMPLLRNADKSKISKRKNPVSLNYYRRKGILPEAMCNFLALMGWAYSEDREFFTLDEMIERFELKQIHLGGPVFDVQKLCHVNQHYLQKLDPAAFAQVLRDEVFTTEYLQALQPLLSTRLTCFEQFVDKAGFFFNGALSYTGLELVPKGKTTAEWQAMVGELLERVDAWEEWQAGPLQALMQQHCQELGWKARDYFISVRLILTGRVDSPPLAESIEALGREMVRFRLRDALTQAG